MQRDANIICGVIYRQHNSPERFQTYMEETMEKLTMTNKPVYIMGDFNINLLHLETCNYVQNFIFSLQTYNMIPTIDKPTRVHNNSATLIDNIFVNKMENEIISGNIVSDISDHYSQFCIMRSNKNILTNKHQKSLIRDYSAFTETNFLNELSYLDLSNVASDDKTVNQSFSTC